MVQCNDIIDLVLFDWSGFKQSQKIEQIEYEVAEFAGKFLREVMAGKIRETQIAILEDHRDEIEPMKA